MTKLMLIPGRDGIRLCSEEGQMLNLSLEEAVELARDLNAHFAIRNRMEHENMAALIKASDEDRTFEGG